MYRAVRWSTKWHAQATCPFRIPPSPALTPAAGAARRSEQRLRRRHPPGGEQRDGKVTARRDGARGARDQPALDAIHARAIFASRLIEELRLVDPQVIIGADHRRRDTELGERNQTRGNRGLEDREVLVETEQR